MCVYACVCVCVCACVCVCVCGGGACVGGCVHSPAAPVCMCDKIPLPIHTLCSSMTDFTSSRGKNVKAFKYFSTSLSDTLTKYYTQRDKHTFKYTH